MVTRIVAKDNAHANVAQDFVAIQEKLGCGDGLMLRTKKKRDVRRAANDEGWISLEGGFARRKCTILDVSAGGARIRTSEPLQVHHEFTLLFGRSGERPHRCRVIWRKGTSVGVTFIK
jgi:hypothetical protein